MSTPAQKANLARIRDNQRRSRARRREYIQELEQRLRAFELQGVEASAEVQMAARRVAGENRQLRELLNKHGFGDDYIAHYLQMGAVSAQDPGSAHRFSAGDPGSSVQSLQHLIAPRRPVGLDAAGVPFPLPTHVNREMSTISTGSSSSWDPQHSGLPSYGHHQAAVPIASQAPHPYASSAFTTEGPAPALARVSPFPQAPPPGAMLEDVSHHDAAAQPTTGDISVAMNYGHINHYHNPSARDYAPPGGYY